MTSKVTKLKVFVCCDTNTEFQLECQHKFILTFIGHPIDFNIKQLRRSKFRTVQ